MKTEQVVEYVAADGSRFRDRVLAEQHEALFLKLKSILDRLPDGKPTDNFYAQHDPQVLRQVKRELFEIVLERYGDRYPEWKTWDPDIVNPRSVVGRVVCDTDGLLSDAWSRLMRYDFASGRQYEQPYFVAHPNEARPLPQS